MTLDEIQSLVDKGRKIFPVIFRGKEPSIPEFKEYANNENTDELLTDLFTRHSKQQGKMNFGMMTGADSGVLTIDLDYKETIFSKSCFNLWLYNSPSSTTSTLA